MKSTVTFAAIAVVLVGAVALPTNSEAHGGNPKPTPSPAKLTYKKDIAPALAKNCVGCHTGPSGKAGVDLTSYKSIMKGKGGKLVVAGKPDKSMLSGVLHGKPKLMPPGKALDAKSITAMDDWIKQGAKEK